MTRFIDGRLRSPSAPSQRKASTNAKDMMSSGRREIPDALASVELRGRMRGCEFGDGEEKTRETKCWRSWQELYAIGSLAARTSGVKEERWRMERDEKRRGEDLICGPNAGRSPGLDQNEGRCWIRRGKKRVRKKLAFVSPDDSGSRQLFDLSLFGRVVQRSPAAAGTSW